MIKRILNSVNGKGLIDPAKIQDNLVKENAGKSPAADESPEELGSILSNYIQQYNKPYVSDSSYIIGEDTMKICVRHFCMMDSAIIVPKK